MTVQDLRVAARTAEIRAGSEDGYQFHGVAVGEGDILHTPDGEPVYFGRRELEAAADTQEDRPLSIDHPTDENGQSIYPPPAKESPGKVIRAKYVPEKGLAYEANLHDEDIAQGIKAGNYEVSVHPKFQLGEFDEEVQAYRPELDSLKFLDLSIVSEGMSPSNTAEWGPSQEILAWTRDGGLEKELHADYDGDNPTNLRDKVAELAREVGLIGDTSDRRGFVSVTDQTSDGESIRVQEATFDDASYVLCAHLEGDEYPEIGPGLGPSIGEDMARDAGEVAVDVSFELDDPLEEDATVYVALHYASEDGEKLDHITTSDGGAFYDSAFVGVAPDNAEVTANSSANDAGGNSGVESNSNMDRETYIREITAEADIDEDALEQMDDDSLEATHDSVVDEDDGADDNHNTIGDMTADELGETLREQGFVTEDNAADLVASASEQINKREKVEEIVAKSDDYNEDDTQDLLASADPLVDKEYKRVRGENAATLPGNAGGMSHVTASADESPEDYGTGVSGDN